MSSPAPLSSPAPGSAAATTAEELLHLPDDGWRYALVEGELQRMTPAGFDHEPGAPPRPLDADVVDGAPLVPGFRLPLADVLA